jgi:hypothetical protein
MKKLSALLLPVLFYYSAAAQIARVQFINNSSDSLMKYVKVFSDNALQKDSLSFRKGTAFISLQGDTAHTIEFRSVSDAGKSVSVTSDFAAGKNYVLVLNGLTNDTIYQKNPDSIAVSLHVVIIDQSTLTAPSPSQINMVFVNGGTDAPAHDLYSNDTSNTGYADNDSLNQFSEALLSDTLVKLKLKTADAGFTISTFLFDFTDVMGQMVTGLTSGFLSPSNNHNGANFAVYFIDSLGNAHFTQNVSLVKNHTGIQWLSLYPNPSAGRIRVQYALNAPGEITFAVYNLKGESFQTIRQQLQQNTAEIDLAGIPAGIYFLQAHSNDSSTAIRFIVQ